MRPRPFQRLLREPPQAVGVHHLIDIPEGLRSATTRWSGEAGERWLASLPGLIAAAAERWSLRVGAPFSGGFTSYVAPATREDGSPAVLKITFPHDEARHEGAALATCDGEGAVRVLESDPDGYVLLIERCKPGTPLTAIDDLDRQIDVATDLLRRWWRPLPAAHPFDHLATVGAAWADLCEERFARLAPRWDGELTRAGITLLRELPGSAPSAVLLHQDFHPGNVLAAQREPWLTIDPKPLVGDPAFDPMQLVTQVGDVLARPDRLRRRVTRLARTLDLDPDRLAAWLLARGVEWALWELDVEGDPQSAERYVGVMAAAARAFSV